MEPICIQHENVQHTRNRKRDPKENATEPCRFVLHLI